MQDIRCMAVLFAEICVYLYVTYRLNISDHAIF